MIKYLYGMFKFIWEMGRHISRQTIEVTLPSNGAYYYYYYCSLRSTDTLLSDYRGYTALAQTAHLISFWAEDDHSTHTRNANMSVCSGSASIKALTRRSIHLLTPFVVHYRQEGKRETQWGYWIDRSHYVMLTCWKAAAWLPRLFSYWCMTLTLRGQGHLFAIGCRVRIRVRRFRTLGNQLRALIANNWNSRYNIVFIPSLPLQRAG